MFFINQIKQKMYQKRQTESQNIKRSMIVLSLSLVLVYIVLYYAKGDLWTNDVNLSIPTTWSVVISELNNDNDINIKIENNEASVESWITDESSILTWNRKSESSVAKIKKTDSDYIEYNDDNKLLSGTHTYYWELDFVETLWISYNYALKDDKNIYYVNMWEYDYDFSDIVRKLKGSLYVMNTEQELIANSMFGDKVTYINIPEYKNQKVLILLEVNDQSWLLAIDYAIYHQVKPYLKTLFID